MTPVVCDSSCQNGFRALKARLCDWLGTGLARQPFPPPTIFCSTMGRVARYKKIKAFDPFSSQNKGKSLNLDNVGVWGLGESGRKPKKRSKTAQKLRARRNKDPRGEDGFDVPPEGDDFDMADIVGSVKKQKAPRNVETLETSTPLTRTTTAVPQKPGDQVTTDTSDRDAERILRLDKQVEPKKEPTGRMEGESKNAFRKRVRAETRQIIQRERTTSNNPLKRQKKKEFLNSKKRGKRGVDSNEGPDDDDRDWSDTKSSVDDPVRFGEQAERPPTFNQLPRGATAKKQKTSDGKGRIMAPEEVESEQKAMELIRKKVQAQYAEIRRKRRGNA